MLVKIAARKRLHETRSATRHQLSKCTEYLLPTSRTTRQQATNWPVGCRTNLDGAEKNPRAYCPPARTEKKAISKFCPTITSSWSSVPSSCSSALLSPASPALPVRRAPLRQCTIRKAGLYGLRTNHYRSPRSLLEIYVLLAPGKQGWDCHADLKQQRFTENR